jgi:hypothetical protein
MPARYDGAVAQSSNLHDDSSYGSERLYFPVLGIVLSITSSDDPQNRTATFSQDQRGSRTEATVLILNDGSDNPWVIPNVVVLPGGLTGIDNYHEEIPRGCSQMLDGSSFNSTFAGIDVEKLDGDWCIVQFIGGSIEQAFISNWWPHPGNVTDPATSGVSGNGILNQGRRFFKRYQGTKFTITDSGNVFVDTTNANAKLGGSPSGPSYQASEKGGDIQVDVKASRQLQLNWNPPIEPYVDQSVPQKNPPPAPGKTRETSASYITFTKDELDFLAGKIIKIIAQTETALLQSKKDVTVKSTDGNAELVATEVHLNGNGHPAPLFDTFEQDLAQCLTDLSKGLAKGTGGGPLLGLDDIQKALATLITTLTSHVYESTKVKNG